jgi:hypothetical protein
MSVLPFKIRILFVLMALTVFVTICASAQAQQASEKEPNNEISQANPLALNQEIRGYAATEDDEDWYLLTIPEPGVDILVVEVTGVPDVDLRLEVRAPGEEESAEMDGNEKDGDETIVRLKSAPPMEPTRIRLTPCAPPSPA